MSPVKLESKYVLSAVKSDQTRVFYDTDAHSGGYPYWSTSYYGCKKFDSLDKVPAIGRDDYLRKEVIRTEVLMVETFATVLSSEDIVSAAKAKAMAEIAEIQRKLEEKTRELRSMS